MIIASEFNRFFIDIDENVKQQLKSAGNINFPDATSIRSMILEYIIVTEVENNIYSLNQKFTPECDGITVLDILRIKSHNSNADPRILTNNYIPIALTSVFSKLIENTIAIKLVTFRTKYTSLTHINMISEKIVLRI